MAATPNLKDMRAKIRAARGTTARQLPPPGLAAPLPPPPTRHSLSSLANVLYAGPQRLHLWLVAHEDAFIGVFTAISGVAGMLLGAIMGAANKGLSGFFTGLLGGGIGGLIAGVLYGIGLVWLLRFITRHARPILIIIAAYLALLFVVAVTDKSPPPTPQALQSTN
jgi:hypothetical protein